MEVVGGRWHIWHMIITYTTFLKVSIKKSVKQDPILALNDETIVIPL